MSVSQSPFRSTYLERLIDEIRNASLNDGLNSIATSATRVLMEWLGYDIEEVSFIDGIDRGVDAWIATDSGIELFQFKTHEFLDGDLPNLERFDSRGVADLSRALNFIHSEQVKDVQRKPLKELLSRRDSLLYSRNLRSDETALPITIHLVLLGDGLTKQGVSEFESFTESLQSMFQVNGNYVQYYAVLYTINDVLDARWREENHKWADQDERNIDEISLTLWSSDYINDNQNAVFYCHAIDLVNAYESLGYQLFEPNVRANIKNSKVNQAIRESVLHQRSRREFRFLNNGVTITCNHFTVPRNNNSMFKVHHPGVVNGLQTVVALHSAYKTLSPYDKEDFEANCAVLVRILTNNVVDDITRVVKATNNQNPMKPRNLMSNTTEQLHYAQAFAQQLGWFYEAKEGAWDAFDKDHKRWRPRLNKHPKDFKIANSRKVRRLDNEDLAQEWLAFIGFAHEAINERKALFDDRFYSLVFKHQTIKHGYDYDFSLNTDKVKGEAINQSPTPSLMLIAHLAREFANEVTPSASQNRLSAAERLGIDVNKPKAVLDAELSADREFVLYQALGGMSVLFTEFVGFVLFRTFGRDLHQYGIRILGNRSFRTMKEGLTENVLELIALEQMSPDDLLTVLWSLFKDLIDDMLSTSWGQSYRAAPVKVRFTFSRDTREKLYRTADEWNSIMRRKALIRPWAIGIRDQQGLYDFVRECVLKE